MTRLGTDTVGSGSPRPTRAVCYAPRAGSWLTMQTGSGPAWWRWDPTNRAGRWTEKNNLLMTRRSDAAKTAARASFWNIKASAMNIPRRGLKRGVAAEG
jgi:hypothetical protein